MKKVLGLVLALLGAVLIVGGASNMWGCAVVMSQSDPSDNALSYAMGRGLAGLLLLALGYGAFRKGRAMWGGAKPAAASTEAAK